MEMAVACRHVEESKGGRGRGRGMTNLKVAVHLGDVDIRGAHVS